MLPPPPLLPPPATPPSLPVHMLPPFAAYCEADPSASYLAGDEFLLASADAVFLVEGVGLPVHMVLLEERCGALTGGKLTGGVSADVVHFSQGRALKVRCFLFFALLGSVPGSVEAGR